MQSSNGTESDRAPVGDTGRPLARSVVDVDALLERVRGELATLRLSNELRAGHTAGVVGGSQLDVDDVMARVRAEIARRSENVNGRQIPDPASGSAGATPIEGHLARWHPAAARLPDQDQYALGDFLRFDDADFIDVVYQKLLKRPADASGSSGYLNDLRSGALSKVEILGDIRFSAEGRRQAVPVAGLLWRYRLNGWRRVRVLGWFVGAAMAVLRLPRLVWRLQGIEASAARETQELGRLVGRVNAAVERRMADADDLVASMRAELSRLTSTQMEGSRALDARLESMRRSLRSQLDAMSCLSDALQGVNTERVRQFEGLSERLASHDQAVSQLQTALRNDTDAHKVALARLQGQSRDDRNRLRAMLDRLTVFLDAAARERSQVSGRASSAAPPAESQYVSFEDVFRGEPGEIKLRVAHYLGTLAAAGVNSGDDGVVLDLGSGRGEWLDVLAEHGYRGRGVDTDRGMLEASRDHGHDVVQADALEYLLAQDDDAFAAITSLHMVEHIAHPVVVQLLDEALRVLRPGGVLILETPNPENVLVGACRFYIDPTHLHPIPPMLLQWVVGSRGFADPVIDRLTDHRGEPELEPVPEHLEGARQINQMIAWFTAPPDYAVVARKPARA